MSCGNYDDLPVQERLVAIDQEIASINENLDSAPVGGWTPEVAQIDAIADSFARARLNTLQSKRKEILASNPQLAANLSANMQAGSGAKVSDVKLGQVVGSVSLAGQCGLPESSVSQNDRQTWYNEASKGGQTGPFQNDASARAEIMSLPVPAGFASSCEAANKQVYAFLPSLNQAIKASNKLHSGNGVGFRCGAPGASGATACTATNIVYGLKTVSYMCHQVCKAGK